MHFIYSFDIAALFIEVLVLYFFYKKKSMPIKNNRIYIHFVYTLILVTILDAVTSFNDERSGILVRPVVYLLNSLYLLGTTSFSFVFSFYALSLSNSWNTLKTKKKPLIISLISIPYILIVILILITPFIQSTDFAAFYVSELNTYKRGGIGFILLYIVAIFYMISTLIILLIFRNEIDKEKRNLIIVFFVTIFVSVGIQYFIPELLFECFGISLTTLTFLFFIQKPEEVLDNVTGLFNQTAFVRMYIGKGKPEENVYMIGITINDIPFISNTFGIQQLNAFLKSIADYLRQNYKFSNIFCINQGTFCLVFNNKDKQEISKEITKISSRFKNPWMFDDKQMKFYAQLCVIKCPENAKTPEDVFDIIGVASSDERYKQPLIYAEHVDVQKRRNVTYIEYCVRKGLSENRFEVYYQPIYSAAEKRVIGGESLIRLNDDKGNPISPEIFIPISEKNGTVLRIGEFVIETVCRDLSRVDIAEIGIKDIHINLSVAQCMQDIIADQILTIMSMYQIPVNVINMEITETLSAHTPEIMLQNINKLVEAGLSFSLDDFGSGYSNMSYMLNMPFNMIKIDKYIVWSALNEKRAEIALSSTIKMIKDLGMTVLAEGVETKEQADKLIALGCDFLQGYYYSKPVPFNAFLETFKKTF